MGIKSSVFKKNYDLLSYYLRKINNNLIYLKYNKIVLIKSETGYEIYLFKEVARILNKKKIGCISIYKDKDYFKYYDKASIIFEWGDLSKKYNKKKSDSL